MVILPPACLPACQPFPPLHLRDIAMRIRTWSLSRGVPLYRSHWGGQAELLAAQGSDLRIQLLQSPPGSIIPRLRRFLWVTAYVIVPCLFDLVASACPLIGILSCFCGCRLLVSRGYFPGADSEVRKKLCPCLFFIFISLTEKGAY